MATARPLGATCEGGTVPPRSSLTLRGQRMRRMSWQTSPQMGRLRLERRASAAGLLLLCRKRMRMRMRMRMKAARCAPVAFLRHCSSATMRPGQ